MLRVRLTSIMRREIEFRKLQLSPYCVAQLESLIRQGIVRMELIDAHKNPGHTMRAETNIKALIAYLVGCSKDAGTFPVLSESEYDAAMRSPPPLWPFCAAG